LKKISIQFISGYNKENIFVLEYGTLKTFTDGQHCIVLQTLS